MTVKELQEELSKYPSDMKVVIENIEFMAWDDVEQFEVVKITGKDGDDYQQSPEGEEMLRIA